MMVTMMMMIKIVFKMLSHWNLVGPSYKDRGLTRYVNSIHGIRNEVTFQIWVLLAPRWKPQTMRSHVCPGAVRHWLLLPSFGITAWLLSRTAQRSSLSKSESLGHNFHCMYDRYKDYRSDTKRITTANSCTVTQSRDYAGESDHNKTHTLNKVDTNCALTQHEVICS